MAGRPGPSRGAAVARHRLGRRRLDRCHRRLAVRNFTAWLELTVALEEPVEDRLPPGVPVTFLVSDHTGVDAVVYRIRAWEHQLGCPVRLLHRGGTHADLLHDAELVGMLSGRPLAPSPGGR